jgi:hypothetical protein
MQHEGHEGTKTLVNVSLRALRDLRVEFAPAVKTVMNWIFVRFHFTNGGFTAARGVV